MRAIATVDTGQCSRQAQQSKASGSGERKGGEEGERGNWACHTFF